MRVLVDTNILLRSAQPNHPLSSQANFLHVSFEFCRRTEWKHMAQQT
jgi:hypothetical protein